METAERELTQCVKVAVNVRPLTTTELANGSTDCITVVPGEPQVQIGTHAFTFDHVYGRSGSPSSSSIFDECVAPLVEGIFNGYNATVLAYGQTGSGKTYTMGTVYTGEANNNGIIPRVMEMIFSKVDSMKDHTEFLIRVSFIEIFKEEVYDLLDPNPPNCSKGEGFFVAKPSIPSKVPIQIRETPNGGITLAGVTEAEVRTKEEMASFLSRGSLSRATGSTNMNSQSSRSHAIFTISIEQKKNITDPNASVNSDDMADDILCAKLHLVDLAGSERAKRTGADGLRLKEGIHINKGLLALGNVISALGDEKKRKEGAHVPYRDSKLTRLLQDSLGGNSRTVMIACVSPADTNAEETLNTLKYANRARNIQNKAIINRDPMAAQMQRLRNQLEQLQAELIYYRSEGAPFEELQVLKQRVSLLETSNSQLHQELQESQITCDRLSQRAVEAQVEKDKLLIKLESARNGKPWDEIDNSDENQDFDVVKGYVSKIQELEGKLQYLQSLNKYSRHGFVERLDLEDDGIHSKDENFPSLHDSASISDAKGDLETEKELEHSSLQDKLDRELKELDKRLEQKEAEMKRFAKVDTSVLQQHYEKKLLELEQEKKSLLKEIEELRSNLTSISSASDDGAQKLKEAYLQKLNALESQVSELKRKQEAQSQLLRQKQKSDEAAKRLQDEIQRIKSQKVQLQQKIKQESEQFRLWKASREKEVLQLKKEGRRNEYEMHKLLALNQRQKMVLQRKTEEAAMATKRLKELLEAKRVSSRETFGAGNGNGASVKALMQAIEHELELTVRVHEVRSEYERQMEVRAAMAKEVARLKQEAEMVTQKKISEIPETMSPGARNSRIFALENMLTSSSSTLVAMASQLSEAEERERVFSGRGRWNQVRSLAEAKNIMNFLFDSLSSSRCQLHDREVDCKEKDSVVKELKEKVVRLSSSVRQLEAQIAEMHHQQKLQRFSAKNGKGNAAIDGPQVSWIGEERHSYDLRKGPRSSYIFNYGGTNMDLLEDMDISDSEGSDVVDEDWEKADDGDWEESGKQLVRKRRSKTGAHTKAMSTVEDAKQETDMNLENTCKQEIDKNAASPASLCCSCSKNSSCKTGKCGCRVAGKTCGVSCGCLPTKCSNRATLKEDDLPRSDSTESGGNNGLPDASSVSDDDKSKELASRGAALLQSAMTEKSIDENANVLQRKPLSDIGNTLIKSNAPKNQRKKWKKSVIQLVPTAPTSAQHENNEDPNLTDTVIEHDIPLKLPRAMNLNTISSNPLRERNSYTTGETASNKETDTSNPRSPIRHAREKDEKENKKF